MSDTSYLSELPADLKAHILRRLTPQMLLSCLQSSKAFWHEDDESLWRTLCKHHLPAHMTKFLQEPTGRLLRSRVDVRRTLFHGLKRQQELRTLLLHELANAGAELKTSHRFEHVVDSPPPDGSLLVAVVAELTPSRIPFSPRQSVAVTP